MPSYTALSYAWGDASNKATLMVDGRMTIIHRSLFNAISTLRSSACDRLIWADAICINQADIHEKNHQVSMMGEIYEGAKNVAVYLGQPTEHTEEGMLSLRSLMDMHPPRKEPSWSDIALPKLEKSFADILSRSWFTRVWTVQETALARNTTLMCGQYHVGWHGDVRTMKAVVFRKNTRSYPHITP
jgi:hypothetical protein